MAITVLTPTNRKLNIKTIVENFLRQEFEEKELIVLLNYDKPDLSRWNQIMETYNNISVLSLGSKISLGRCLNLGISKAKYGVIAKFDDDDYYGPFYLKNSFKSLQASKSDIVGKTSYYIFFKNEHLIGLKISSNENKYCRRVAGSTLLFKKNLFNHIQFKDKNLGEDIDFCNDAIKRGFKIFSNDRNDYLYIRGGKNYHTWKMGNDYILKSCINIIESPDINDFIKRWQI